MSTFRLILVCVIVLFSAQAHAQWADSTVEHDWRLEIGGRNYGIVQTVQYPGEFRRTTIHFGSWFHATPCSVWQLVGMAALPFIVALGSRMVWPRSEANASQAFDEGRIIDSARSNRIDAVSQDITR